MRTDVWALMKGNEALVEWLRTLPTYKPDGDFVSPKWCYAWIWPATTLLTLSCGLLIPARGPVTTLLTLSCGLLIPAKGASRGGC